MAAEPRIFAAAVGCCLLLACSDKPRSQATPSPAKAGCEVPAGLGWMGWLIQDPGAVKRLNELPDAWVSLYRGDLREALKGEGVVRRRAAEELSVTYRALGRLLAEAQRQLITRRRGLGSKPLPHGALTLGASAQALGGDAKAALAEAARDPKQRAWVAAWRAGCADPRAPYAFQRFACVRAGQPAPACGRPRANKLPTPLKARAAAYRAALCAPPAQRLAAIQAARALAGAPIFTDTLHMASAGQGEEIHATVKLFDPLAFWVLAEAYAELASATPTPKAAPTQPLAAAPSGAKAPGTTTPGATSAPGATTPGAAAAPGGATGAWPADQLFSVAATPPPAGADVVQALRALEAKLKVALGCASPEARALIQELKLDSSLPKALLRGAALKQLQAGACDAALQLYQRSHDVDAGLSPHNRPVFLARLARAATACNRSSEAIGALRALREAFPEAKASLEAVRMLAVVRTMGGPGGDQKSQ